MRSWAKYGYCCSKDNPGIEYEVNLTQEFLDELFENFRTCYNYNGYGVNYDEFRVIMDEVCRWDFERHLRYFELKLKRQDEEN